MTAESRRKPTRDEARARRARLREAGLRPVQLWVPDPRDPRLREEARRQSALVARSEGEAEDQTFVDAVSEFRIP